MKKKSILTLGLVAAITLTFSACGKGEIALLTENVKIELGSELIAEAAKYAELDEAAAAEASVDFSAVDTMTVGTYPAVVSYKDQSVNFSVEVKDTTAPAAEAVEEVAVTSGKPLYAKDVLTSVTELSGEVTVSFQAVNDAVAEESVLNEGTEAIDDTKQPASTESIDGTEQPEEAIDQNGTEQPAETAVESFDLAGVTCNNAAVAYTENGEYDNILTITDASGNSTEVTVHIVVGSEPVFEGIGDITATVGAESVDYLEEITAADSNGTDITDKIVCDSSLVDMGTAGTYEVTYTVIDELGFTATEKAAVTVTEEKKNTDKKTSTGTNDKKTDTSKTNAGTSSGSNSNTSGGGSNAGNSTGNTSGGTGNTSGGSTGNAGSTGSTGNTGNTGSTGNSGGTGNTGSTGNGGGSGSTGGSSGGTSGGNTNPTPTPTPDPAPTPTPTPTPTPDPAPDTGSGNGGYDMEVPDGVAPPNQDNTFVPQPGTGADDGTGLGDGIITN